MKTEITSGVNLAAMMQPQSLEQAAMLAQHQQAEDQKTSARNKRAAAQQDAIHAQRKAAEKLRSMASSVRLGGLIGAAIQTASLACSVVKLSTQMAQTSRVADLKADIASEPFALPPEVTKTRLARAAAPFGRSLDRIAVLERSLPIASNANSALFDAHKHDLQAEQKQLEAEASQADQVATRAGEQLADGQALARKARQQMEDMARIRHEMELAPLQAI